MKKCFILMTGVLIFTSFYALNSTEASEITIEECQKRGIGLEEIVKPVAKNVQSFYGGSVNVFNIDYLEPAACPMALAITFPAMDADIEGTENCVVVSCFAAIDINSSQSSYDPNKGLLLSVPYFFSSNGEYPPRAASEPLKIRINLKKSKVSLEN